MYRNRAQAVMISTGIFTIRATAQDLLSDSDIERPPVLLISLVVEHFPSQLVVVN